MYLDFVSGKMVAEPGDPPALDDKALGHEIARRVLEFRRGLWSGFAAEDIYDDTELETALSIAFGTALIRKAVG